jgi:predicted aspartyl protease
MGASSTVKLVARLAIVGVCLAAGGGGSFAAGTHAAKPAADQVAPETVTLQVRYLWGYLPVVEGSIGGRAKQHILIDTGASPAVLDAAAARSLGLDGGPARMDLFDGTIPAAGVWIPELQVGPIRQRSVPALVRDLSYLRRFGFSIDAIVGLDVLGAVSFRLDYQARRLVIGEVTGEGIAIPADDDWPFFVLDAEVEKQRLRLLVDTGAAGLVLFRKHVGTRLRQYERPARASANNLGGRVEATALRGLTVVVRGKRKYLETAFLVPDSSNMKRFDGLLPIGALGFRALCYDHNTHTLYLQP